jgi:hypothetical protein
MPSEDVPVLKERNDELKNEKYEKGQKLCLKRKIFKFPNDSCGLFCSWEKIK